MRVKKLACLLICFLTVAFITGCTVRTYTVVKERVDQDLTEGNRGYFQGTPPPVDPK